MLHRTIFIAMCIRNPLATGVLLGTIFSATAAANRVWEGRKKKKQDDRYVKRNNLSKIRDLVLQVFETGSKTYDAKITQIVRVPMLHGINFCAKNRRSESSRVTSSLCID